MNSRATFAVFSGAFSAAQRAHRFCAKDTSGISPSSSIYQPDFGFGLRQLGFGFGLRGGLGFGFLAISFSSFSPTGLALLAMPCWNRQ
jgi:hypothetical protein